MAELRGFGPEPEAVDNQAVKHSVPIAILRRYDLLVGCDRNRDRGAVFIENECGEDENNC